MFHVRRSVIKDITRGLVRMFSTAEERKKRGKNVAAVRSAQLVVLFPLLIRRAGSSISVCSALSLHFSSTGFSSGARGGVVGGGRERKTDEEYPGIRPTVFP